MRAPVRYPLEQADHVVDIDFGRGLFVNKEHSIYSSGICRPNHNVYERPLKVRSVDGLTLWSFGTDNSGSRLR